jgi:hypothetical protein
VLAPHCLMHLPLAIARKRELRPNPIDSDTSCRKLVAMQAGVSRIAGASFPSAPQLRACPAPSRLRGVRLLDVDPLAADRRPLGPPHAPLREELRDSLHPRCLPLPDMPRPGLSPFVHNLSPACGLWGGRLFNLRAAGAF